MALLTPLTTTAGANSLLSFAAAAAGGDTVSYNPNKRQLLVVKNDHIAAWTVTVAAQRTSVAVGEDNFTRANISTPAVAASTIRVFPLTAAFADATGLINITYSGVTALSVALVEV